MEKIVLKNINVGDIIIADGMTPNKRYINEVVEVGVMATKFLGWGKNNDGSDLYMEGKRKSIRLKVISYYNGEKWECTEDSWCYSNLFAGDKVAKIIRINQKTKRIV